MIALIVGFAIALGEVLWVLLPLFRRKRARFCIECGVPLESGAAFCGDCGTSVPR